MSGPARRERIARVVGAVIRQAVADAGARGVLLLDAERAECPLAREWCVAALGEPQVRTALTEGRWLSLFSATKTTLLLTPVPHTGLLPLGDLYGSEILELGGDWNPPPPVVALAAAAGGAAPLDEALRRWADQRRPLDAALSTLPPAVAAELGAALRASRFARRSCGLVPKLTDRTLGMDLWD